MWLKAYPVASMEGWSIEPAPSKREWMDETFKKTAYRCLPLIIANQAGWVVRGPASFSATWSGKIDNHGIKIEYDADPGQRAVTALSHFGNGILTFVLPWLFRTAPGFGLLVRGLPNCVKDNAYPLEGIVETDWSPYTFTVNWKIIRPGVPVRFGQGDPVCMILPFRLDMLEQFDCTFEPYESAPPDIQRGLYDFAHKRAAGNATAPDGSYETQRDYFTGRYPDGTTARYPSAPDAAQEPVSCAVTRGMASLAEADSPAVPRHRTKLDIKPFEH